MSRKWQYWSVYVQNVQKFRENFREICHFAKIRRGAKFDNRANSVVPDVGGDNILLFVRFLIA